MIEKIFLPLASSIRRKILKKKYCFVAQTFCLRLTNVPGEPLPLNVRSLYVPGMGEQPAPKNRLELAALRLQIAQLQRSGGNASQSEIKPNVLPFGLDNLDQHLPGGGLSLGCLHEITTAGPGVEHGAATSLFVAGLAARLKGVVLWVIERPDLFAPGLAAVGLHPDQIIIAEADKAVLLVMEEGLRHRGLKAVVGEVHGRLDLTASRRLQLAAEAGSVTGFALRRARRHDDSLLAEPNAAVTRWRLSALPSAPALPHAPGVPGLGRARWHVELLRCRGGEPSSWIMGACDAAGRLGMVDAAPGQSAAKLQRQERSSDEYRIAG